MKKSRTVDLPLRIIARLAGVSRDTVSRAVQCLSQNGLVEVEYHQGKAMRVSIPSAFRDYQPSPSKLGRKRIHE